MRAARRQRLVCGCGRDMLLWGVLLGLNEEVRCAVGRSPVKGRGIRILSMDGGGMKVRGLCLPVPHLLS